MNTIKLFLLSFLSILLLSALGSFFICEYVDYTNAKNLDNSKVPIDIVLVAHKKDFDVVPYSINSIKKYLKQPIKRIVLISEPSPQAEKLVTKLGIDFIDENSILNKANLEQWFNKNNLKLNYQNFSWYYQQFLKLLYYKHSLSENYLVIDADIVMNRPFVLVSDYNITTYFIGQNSAKKLSNQSIRKLLGNDQYIPEFSYIADLMCFNTIILEKMINKIEDKFNAPFYETAFLIDQNPESRFSEYELYGVFANHSVDNKMIASYIPSVAAEPGYYENYLSSIHFFSSGHSRKRTTLFLDRYNPSLKAYPYIAYHSWIPHYGK